MAELRGDFAADHLCLDRQPGLGRFQPRVLQFLQPKLDHRNLAAVLAFERRQHRRRLLLSLGELARDLGQVAQGFDRHIIDLDEHVLRLQVRL